MMMVYLFAESRAEIDRWKAVEIAMMHDLVEVYAGDVNLWDDNKVHPEDKHAAENLSAKKLFALLPKDLNDKFYALWKEYEARQTNEAKFVYALDKLQPFVQRIVANDNGWKEKRVDRSKLDEV
jgi:putative hydrolases of HD superfamily